MKEYTFTVQFEDYTVTLALAGDWSLHAFAYAITKAIGFDFDHAFEFCDNIKNPRRSKKRYSVFAEDCEIDENGFVDPGVDDVLISDVFTRRKAMVFHYDFGDDWYFVVRCTAITETDAKESYSKVLSTVGTPPEQYPDYEDEEE